MGQSETEKVQKENDKINIHRNISANYTKEELKDLNTLLSKIGATGKENLWIAGYPNFKQNQNPIVANILSGKKNYRFLTNNGDLFYLLSIKKDVIASYKTFRKEYVETVKVERRLFTKNFKVVLKDRSVYSVVVMANKDKIADIKEKLR